MRASHEGRPRHGIAGKLLGWLTLVLPGAVAIAVAVLRDALPADWLRYPEPLSESAARWLVFSLGVALLVVAWGYFRFRRIGWLGYAAWAVAALVTFLSRLVPGEGTIVIDLFPLLVLAGFPYLWARRRDFGIGPDPNAGIRR